MPRIILLLLVALALNLSACEEKSRVAENTVAAKDAKNGEKDKKKDKKKDKDKKGDDEAKKKKKKRKEKDPVDEFMKLAKAANKSGQEDEAIGLFRQSCTEAENDKACKQLVKLYEKRCNANDYFGCFGLGVSYGKGRGVKQDYIKASEAYVKACEGGQPIACHNLGNANYDARGIAKNVEKSTELYKKACDGGYDPSCTNYALNLIYDTEPPKADKGVEILKGTCEKEDGIACEALGSLYEKGTLAPLNTGLSKSYYQKACNFGDADSCNKAVAENTGH